jgi:hypothetical protein
MTDRCARLNLVQWLQQPVRWLWSGVQLVGRFAGNPGAAPPDAQARTNELLEALVAAQVRTTDLIGALGSAPKPQGNPELREQVEALRREVELLTLASAPSHARLETLADAVLELKESFRALPFAALEQRLNQAVKAQERTNELLEFALRAGFEEDERTRGV